MVFKHFGQADETDMQASSWYWENAASFAAPNQVMPESYQSYLGG
jgi:hypothetical protein